MGEVGIGEVGVAEVGAGEVGLAEVGAGEVGADKAGSSQVKWVTVPGFVASAEHREDSLHIRGWMHRGKRLIHRRFENTGCYAGACCKWCVFANKRREHFYHRGMVAYGVARDAFQGINAAEAHLYAVPVA